MPMSNDSPFTTDEIPDLKGWVALVTGGNSGIGFETVYQLASRGARVYLAARSTQRINEAIARMKSTSATDLDLCPLIIDLQSLQSVKEAAETFMKQEKRLDILINNAGVCVLHQA
ncbi:MAG: hypothetical protein Q9218_003575 [Villophora microphyllina]